MKLTSLFKPVGCAVALGLSALCANAVSSFQTNLVGGASFTNSIFTNAIRITGIKVVNPTTNSVVLCSFYDSNVASNTYATSAYTNSTTYTTNFVTLYTNTLGSVQSNYYVGIWTTTNLVAAATSTLPAAAQFSVAGLGTDDRTIDLLCTKGLSVKCNTNATVTITYTPILH